MAAFCVPPSLQTCILSVAGLLTVRNEALESEKWMISAEERHCSNRVLMLTRVKRMLSLPQRWRCGYSKMHLIMITTVWIKKKADIVIIMALWLFMCKWLNAIDYKSHEFRPLSVSHWVWSVPFNVLWSVNLFCSQIIRNFSVSLSAMVWLTTALNSLICCHALLTFFQTLPANARPELPTHEFLQLLHRRNIYNEPLLFCSHVSIGSPTASHVFFPSQVQQRSCDISLKIQCMLPHLGRHLIWN